MLTMRITHEPNFGDHIKAHYTAGEEKINLSSSRGAGSQVHTVHIEKKLFDEICAEYILIRQRENGRTR
jgi:hypothetical protein